MTLIDRPTIHEIDRRTTAGMYAFSSGQVTLNEAGKIMKGITTLDKILWYKHAGFWKKILIWLGIEKYEE